MTETVEQQAEREAAEWHARLQSRSVSNVELERFYDWRSTPGNALAFDAVDAMWHRAAQVGDDPRIQAAISAVGREEKQRRRSLLGLDFRHWGAGALAAVALVVAFVFLIDQPTTYRTGVGQTLVVLLDDGSKVTLNTSSKIAVRFTQGLRNIELVDGQALFEVAPDPSRPFRVTADDASVTALGTEFEVRRSDGQVSVTLVHGQIAVVPSEGARSAKLTSSGQTLATAGANVALGKSDPGVVLSWVEGKIDLRERPLSSAIEEVNRYTREPIVLDSPTQGGIRVSGVFATGDRDAFVAAVTTLLPLKQSKDANGTIHLRNADER